MWLRLDPFLSLPFRAQFRLTIRVHKRTAIRIRVRLSIRISIRISIRVCGRSGLANEPLSASLGSFLRAQRLVAPSRSGEIQFDFVPNMVKPFYFPPG